MAHHPGTSASGPATGMLTRSLHARGGGAPGDTFRIFSIYKLAGPLKTR
jgi:hypothetical protein